MDAYRSFARLMRRLSKKLREVFVPVALWGQSIKEVAARLRIPTKTAESRMHLAKEVVLRMRRIDGQAGQMPDYGDVVSDVVVSCGVTSSEAVRDGLRQGTVNMATFSRSLRTVRIVPSCTSRACANSDL
jgi:hypothetical protein